jgi:hypothetical protein
MAITHTSANAILNKMFGNTVLSQPTTYYLGLSQTTPAQDGSNVTEPSGSNYSRVSISNSDHTNWGTSTVSTLSNLTSFTFPASTGSWGTVTFVVLYDAPTGGNLWFFDVLTPSRSIAASTTVLFSASAFTLSMSNS